MDMKVVDSTMVEEVTKEEVKVLDLVEDMDRSFVIIVTKQVILREIVRSLQWHVSTVNPLTM